MSSGEVLTPGENLESGERFETSVHLKPNENLKRLGIELPVPPARGGLYAPVRVVGKLAFVSGQVPFKDGAPLMTGALGDGPDGLSVEQGQACARQCALNTLAVLDAHFADVGGLDAVAGCVKLFALVRCADDFTTQPQVVNAASQVMIDVFGDAGWHARSAVGTNALPGGVPVEIESVFELV